jgi:nucleoside-diphosphate-sugar epimerase
MRVLVTGATGFIGSRVVSKLINAGHTVVGMTRSDAGAATLEAMGAEAHWASLEDPESVARGAAGADAVIHTAFDHDFSRYVENCEKDARVIQAIGAALGAGQPLIVTSATGTGANLPGEIATEGIVTLDPAFPRSASERAAAEVAANGGSVAVVRLPQVHDTMKQGLVTFYIELARQAGVCVYVGEGANRWCASHVDDVALLYQLAMAQHQPGARWHAVAEEGVAFREIAEVVGAGLGVPAQSMTLEEAGAHFGWMAGFIAADMAASSAITRASLGWQPSGPSLLDDLRAMDHSIDTARF